MKPVPDNSITSSMLKVPKASKVAKLWTWSSIAEAVALRTSARSCGEWKELEACSNCIFNEFWQVNLRPPFV